MPAWAQGTGTSPATNGTTADLSSRNDNDRGFNWGWLGLIGLVGLLGLRKKPDMHGGDATRSSSPPR